MTHWYHNSEEMLVFQLMVGQLNVNLRDFFQVILLWNSPFIEEGYLTSSYDLQKRRTEEKRIKLPQTLFVPVAYTASLNERCNYI